MHVVNRAAIIAAELFTLSFLWRLGHYLLLVKATVCEKGQRFWEGAFSV